jgi:hypothetical protein
MCQDTQRMPRMDVRTWAHPTWEFIHRLPALPGIDRRDRIATAFCVLIYALPCPTCRSHATAWIQKHSPFSVPLELFPQYFFNFHNSVSKRLGQRDVRYSILSRYRGDPRMWFGSMEIAIQSFSSNSGGEHLRDVAAILG